MSMWRNFRFGNVHFGTGIMKFYDRKAEISILNEINKTAYKKAGTFRTVAELRTYLAERGIDLPLAESGENEAMRRPIDLFGRTLPNRWAILPMEGWDCTSKGAPSEYTLRRWLNFARSGASMICGTEAGAVMHAAKSNPYQLLISRENLPELKAAVQAMRRAHAEKFGSSSNLLIGIQLTHSGRFAHPNKSDVLESAVAYNHPLLDRKFGTPRVVPDAEVKEIVGAFKEAARVAREAGFDFVDVKHAHGYLGHEFLTAFDRPGPYGGSFENRTRFSREIAESIKTACPDLPISMRFSIFDIQAFEKGPDGFGVAMQGGMKDGLYKYAFGGSGDGLTMDPDLKEPAAFLKMMKDYGIDLICNSIGSPYYNVHIQRPAYYPVCDGYEPPADPLFNVARHIQASKRIKELCPWLKTVLSGITCLQEYAACAAEAAVRDGAADFAGIGRMALPYADYCADHLAGKPFDKRRICRTFGDCTNAPRHGEISGCYPLDEFYRKLKKCAAK